MSKREVPWNLKEVVAVHILRLAVGFLLVRVIYPGWVNPTQPIVEITDRAVMCIMVWLAVRLHGDTLGAWGIPGPRQIRNSAVGIGAGFILLAVSFFSERVYTSMFFLTPSQHPLVLQVENAMSWRDLILPLFLAGVAAPVAEELLYRLFTFRALAARFGLWGGAIGSAAIFALFHFNAYWLPELMIVGIGLSLLYFWTGSLLSSIAAHFLVNTAKILLLYLNII